MSAALVSPWLLAGLGGGDDMGSLSVAEYSQTLALTLTEFLWWISHFWVLTPRPGHSRNRGGRCQMCGDESWWDGSFAVNLESWVPPLGTPTWCKERWPHRSSFDLHICATHSAAQHTSIKTHTEIGPWAVFNRFASLHYLLLFHAYTPSYLTVFVVPYMRLPFGKR